MKDVDSLSGLHRISVMSLSLSAFLDFCEYLKDNRFPLPPSQVQYYHAIHSFKAFLNCLQVKPGLTQTQQKDQEKEWKAVFHLEEAQ